MNNSWLTFDPLLPLWVIVLLVLPIFAFFIWKEINRPHKFLIARIAAQVLILPSILGLLLRPSYHEQRSKSPILLLTHGYDKLKVDSLLKENGAFKIIRTPESNPYPNSEVLPSYHNLSLIEGGINIVVGQGLPEYAFGLIEKKNFKFIPAAPEQGIVELSAPNQIVVNRRNSVKGVFNASTKTTLKLTGPAGAEDSVIFNTSGRFPFELTFKPRQPGLFVYHLSYLDSGKKVKSERLPLEIKPEEKLNILILQKFPTAEVRYLKNYLAEKGHALALRYQTSKTNFKYEYANIPSIKVNRLTPELAESFDLILTDNLALEEMSGSEKIALEKAIHEGLGLIILADDFSEKDKSINRFLPLKTKQVTNDTVHMKLSGSKTHVLPIIPVEITPDVSTQSIQQHNGRLLSGYVYTGAGKIGFQLLKETYRISLEGNKDDYSFIWSDLIERTARTKNESFKINLVNNFPYYPDEPLTIDIISSKNQPSLYEDKNPVPLTEDVIIDDFWHGKTWAGKPGWHHFTTQDSTELNYFVSTVDEWKTLRLANQIRSNELAQVVDSGNKTSPRFFNKALPVLLFFLIFLFASGFLWLVPKL